MEAERPDSSEPAERLHAVLLDLLESAERGSRPDRAALQARYPDLAAELQEFVDTWVSVERITEPIRSASQIMRAAGHSEPGAAETRQQKDSASRAGAGNGDDFRNRAATRDTGAEEGGWLGRWLRQHPPL